MSHIRVDGNLVSLLYLPTPTFIRGYNGMLTLYQLTGRPMFSAFIRAKDILVGQGLIVEMPDGTLRQII